MLQQRIQPQTKKCARGFSLPEVIITASIVSVLGSVALPAYNDANNSAKLSEAKANMLSIPSIIGAYIDATGETPTTWDDLSTIAPVMTNDGLATGDLTSPITLPNSNYDLLIEGPTESIYTLTATRVIDKTNGSLKKKHAIKSCFDVSNGASDIRSGTLADIENELNCG